ncbi:MAG TPA: polysaccharide deacetylase family protein [Solirubrobacterales bacterium]|nr:polysaccharide deacetylase family protein [Solirubrobacterales bacterium]
MSNAFANRSGEAVFLCYHSIASAGAEFLALAPDAFERQLAGLRRRRYRSGGIADLRRLAAGERLPGRTAFLTFDDGYRDNHDVAMPLMREYGFKPLVFLLPRHVDEGAGFRWPEVAELYARHPDRLRSLRWSQVDEMVEQGAEFGSHTLTHPHLRELDDEQLGVELGQSKAELERRLGACDMLAYPFGEWDERVAAAAGAAGYRFAFSLPQGPQAEGGPLFIPRVNVDNRDRPGRFRLKLHPLVRQFLLSDAGERLRGVRRLARRGGGRRA